MIAIAIFLWAGIQNISDMHNFMNIFGYYHIILRPNLRNFFGHDRQKVRSIAIK